MDAPPVRQVVADGAPEARDGRSVTEISPQLKDTFTTSVPQGCVGRVRFPACCIRARFSLAKKGGLFYFFFVAEFT